MSVATYVPSKQNQNWSSWYFPDVSLETLLGLALSVFQSITTNLQQILASRDSCGDLFGSVGYRSSHLLRELPSKDILFINDELQRSLNNDLAFFK